DRTFPLALVTFQQSYDVAPGETYCDMFLGQVDMNPSKFQKSEMGATSKNLHHTYIQSGALARGRGHNFGSLGSIKISFGKRTLIGESKNHNSTAFEQNKLAHTKNLVPPGFALMEEDAPLSQCPEAIQGASKQNKLAHSCNNLMPPGFNTMEDDIPFTQEAEMMQEVGAIFKNVRDTYSQPSALARGCGQNLRFSGSAKGSVGKRNLIGKSKNHNSTASEQNKLAHNSTNLMPPSFDPMEDDFEGLLPTEGVFSNATAISISGNKNLCGDIPELKLPTCPNTKPKGRDKSCSIKLMIPLLSRLVALVLIMSLVIIFRLRKAKKESSLVSSPTWGFLLRVTYENLFRAINGFPSANLIGNGGFSYVYKGVLDPGERLVVVKVINIAQLGAFKSFMSEWGGITTKELKGGSSSKAAILSELNATRKEKESLQTELNATKKAKESLEKRMDDFETKYNHLISLLVDQPSSAPSRSQQSTS
ncbi:putative receptor-like protein kinase, partial [Nicotiana attenuata]